MFDIGLFIYECIIMCMWCIVKMDNICLLCIIIYIFVIFLVLIEIYL